MHIGCDSGLGTDLALCLWTALLPSQPLVLDGDVAASVMVSCGDSFLLHDTLAAVLFGTEVLSHQIFKNFSSSIINIPALSFNVTWLDILFSDIKHLDLFLLTFPRCTSSHPFRPCWLALVKVFLCEVAPFAGR